MDISIIIPTYNEGTNVQTMVSRLTKVILPLNRTFEILFMDDSTDDTPQQLGALSEKYPFVNYIHRVDMRGLASAVTDGLKNARGSILIVMDSDLQHPPELIPDLLNKINEGYQMVIPSRFIAGGNDGGLNYYRKLVSWTARIIARLTLKRLRKTTDPTSGFFAVRKSALEGKEFHPIGWKIMLEIIVRANIDQIAEIPYHFQARDLGSSKMNAAEQLKYLIHLFKLILESEEDRRFYLFCLVGSSGVVINLLVYKLMLSMGMPIMYAFLISSLISILSNYLLNNAFTWRMRHKRKSRFSWFERMVKYVIVSIASLCVSSGVLSSAHYLLHLSPMLSGMTGIAASVIINFVVNDKWTFTTSKKNLSDKTVMQHVEK
ncbi:glycosyltransferase family 2 protein [Sporolactobacillus shoreicorticis]|uniref:Glycosyltransferase n=1 Tax=Sporolactobacillus shoreicorticis TaxID=1923877 RepID=A0ABW5S4M7_9BACL|nr:glycosyltransferase family 2 protein [Sporolactobacillus shoreicorticis]MCO7126395.1 glycosyltransferase family 2 protein [Sporolactobacillus shoreicorticis]